MTWEEQGLFKHLFLLTAGALIFFFLPVDLAFRFNSRPLATDIAVNTAAMALLLIPIAAFVALCVLLAALPVRMFGGQRAYRMTCNLLLLFSAGSYFFQTFNIWVILTFRHYISGTWTAIVFLAFAALIILGRGRLQKRLNELAGAIRKPLILCAAVSLCLVGWRLATTDTRPESREHDQKPARAAGHQPNVILVTFDALSAEDMSLYGYHLPTTPNLDKFARECYVFQNAVSASNWTKPAVLAILTGKYPIHHGVDNLAYYYHNNPKPEESLPAVLMKSAYYAVALAENWPFAHPYANGLAPFFEEKPVGYIAWRNLPIHWKISSLCFRYGLPLSQRFRIEALNWLGAIILEDEAKSFASAVSNNYRFRILTYNEPFYPPELIFKNAEQYLADDRARSDNRPLFIWIHVYAPHDPYLPPLPFKGRFTKGEEFGEYYLQRWYQYRMYSPYEQPAIDRLRLRYDENVLYADARFGDFVAFLRSTKRLSDSIVVVAADHGESFSHGFTPHGNQFFWESLVHIPLMVRVPDQKTGRIIRGTVSQVDIAPTILDLLGKPIPSWMDGASLKPFFNGKDAPSNPAFSMRLPGDATPETARIGISAVVDASYKYIRDYLSGDEKLYDLRNDPDETKNLVHALPEQADHLKRLLSVKFGQ